jgi:hypothetical protein
VGTPPNLARIATTASAAAADIAAAAADANTDTPPDAAGAIATAAFLGSGTTVMNGMGFHLSTFRINIRPFLSLGY